MIRQFHSLLLCGLTGCFLLFSLPAEDKVRVFEEARSAISAARQEDKMIVFFLSDKREKNHASLEKELIDELNRLEGDFILVKSHTASSGDRELYSGRFGKNLDKLPLAVISNPNGEELASTSGEAVLEYQKMLVQAKIKSGKISDPLVLAALREKLKSLDERAEGKSRGLFDPILEDLQLKKRVLSPLRSWTRKDGFTLKAHLVEALGDSGNFINEQGETINIKFATLSDGDIAYLQSVLSPAR